MTSSAGHSQILKVRQDKNISSLSYIFFIFVLILVLRMEGPGYATDLLKVMEAGS